MNKRGDETADRGGTGAGRDHTRKLNNAKARRNINRLQRKVQQETREQVHVQQ